LRTGDSAVNSVEARSASPSARIVAALRSRARSLAHAAAAARVDLAIVAAITLLAAVLRTWHLGTVPLGLHGDEAWTGLDARRVLHEGWIGPYLMSAVGQPIGPLYFTALLFKFMPQTTFTLRFSMALFGIATIPLAYAAFATMFNRTVAAFASLLLAVMMWHLHLSRTGFMVVAWPFFEMAVLLALWHAMRLRSVALFGVAGALTGLGIYTYNAFYLFIPLPFVAVLWTYVPWRRRAGRHRTLLHVATFVAAGLVVSIPMLQYIVNNPSDYRYHQKLVSLTNSDQWRDADGVAGHADLVWKRAVEWQDALINGDHADYGDGLATKHHPPVGRATFALMLAGTAVALWNWRKAEYAVVLAALVTMPWGALLTVGAGMSRRTMGLAPFVALLAALPLAWAWQRLLRASGRRRYAAALVLAVPAVLGGTTTYQYFGPVQDTAAMRFIYPYQMDAASHFIAGLPPGTTVYFFSSHWSFDYETRRFIAPRAAGVDRSREFRLASREITEDPIDLAADLSGDVAFVFLDSYLDQLDEVVGRYPGGAITETTKGEETLYRAYVLPQKR
jgi:4-amino-4-deoxy-L-arabinose transferase-like glycosyltransferase